MKENWLVEAVLMVAVVIGFLVAFAAVARLAVKLAVITMGGEW